jgi:hypothetical protein
MSSLPVITLDNAARPRDLLHSALKRGEEEIAQTTKNAFQQRGKPERLGTDYKPYEALFVLLDQSKRFTGLRRQPYMTSEEVIEEHRRIFLQWAYKEGSNQAILFNSFGPGDYDFFLRFYVTDCWRNGTVRSKHLKTILRIELQEVPTERVVLIGDEAWRASKYVPDGLPAYGIEAPWKQDMTRREYQSRVADLWERINAS